MKYCFDLDGTICDTPCDPDGHNQRYWDSLPIPFMVETINRLYDEGHHITYFTARAMGRNSDKPIDEAKRAAEEVLKPLTVMQLDIWGCKYHELIMGKPHADLFIDDKGINCDDFFKD